ncbi:MAG: hypothetical protein EXR52_07655 [Dehalococcoidia bacterium]|nr:hypothetical protein [Dehalococcoidia bacterium]
MNTHRSDQSAFESALDACLARMAAGATSDECVAGYPEPLRTEVRNALAAVYRLRQAGGDPESGYVGRLEYRLWGAVAARGEQQRAWLGLGAFLRPRALGRSMAAVVLVLLVLAGTGVGAVQAWEGSLPDSPLYAVKTTIEQVNVATASSEAEKLDVRLRQIPQQLSDFINASRANRPDPMVRRLVTRVTETLTHAVDQAIQAQASGDAEPNRRVRNMIRTLKNRLTQLPEGPAVVSLQGLSEEQEQRLPPRPRPVRPAPTPAAANPTPAR